MKTDVEVANPIFALIEGKPLTHIPADLFIPAQALNILLDSFTGPLDLLLYLIRRQNIDILNIPMVAITQQYMQYITLIEAHQLELAADYLVMAAILIEIKSKMLLPSYAKQLVSEEEDPRLILVRKLQDYEVFKEAAIQLDHLPRHERDTFRLAVYTENVQQTIIQPEVTLSAIIEAMQHLLTQHNHRISHCILREPLSVQDKMLVVLDSLQQEKTILLGQLLCKQEGRPGLIVTFLAILELARQSLLVIIQAAAYSPVYLQVDTYGG